MSIVVKTPKVDPSTCDHLKVAKVDPCAVNPCLTKTLCSTDLVDPCKTPDPKVTCTDISKACGSHLPIITIDPPKTTDPSKGTGCSTDPKITGCGGLVGNHDGCCTHTPIVCHTTPVVISNTIA